MGSWSWTSRLTVEKCMEIDVFWLRRHDWFCGFRSGTIVWKNSYGEEVGSVGLQAEVFPDRVGEDYVRFIYTNLKRTTKEKTDLDYKVQLVKTPCNFGKFRYWFICPLTKNGVYCGRRVGKLYLPPNGMYFGCRRCYNLTYKSCQEHDKRLDWARRLPPEALKKMLESGDPRTALLGIRAVFKNLP